MQQAHHQTGTDLHSGLEEVKALSSSITDIKDNYLRYRGLDVIELAQKSTFEEVIYLLWNKRLPGKAELGKLVSELQQNEQLPPEIVRQITQIPRNAHPMAALRTLVSSLALYDDDEVFDTAEGNYPKAIRIMAKMPVLVAAVERHRKGKSMIEPRTDLSLAENLLFTLTNEVASEVEVKALNSALILYAEHELNASTFAARVATGTLTDLYSAVVCALATLKGLLHGGANELAMKMILDIAQPEMVEDYVNEQLAKKNRIMGFGHRVYREGDPRAKLLKEIAFELCEQKGFQKYFQIAEGVENTMQQKKGLLPNVDLYSALVFYALGFATDMYTSVFAFARTSGWIAHIFEQYENNRLIRPRAVYEGPENVAYVEIDKR